MMLLYEKARQYIPHAACAVRWSVIIRGPDVRE